MRQALGALSALVPIGIVGVGPNGESWYHNQRWEDICGRPGVAMRGVAWYEAVHPDDVVLVAEAWRARAENRGQLGRFRVQDRDGTVRVCKADAIAMVDEDGTLYGHLLAIVDADSAGVAPALSNADFLDAVLDRSDDIVTILNPDGTWRWSSGGTRRFLGHHARYEPTEGLLRFVHPDDQERAIQTMARFVAGAITSDERFELRLRSADGSWRDLEGLVDYLVDDPAVRGIVIHARDITERKRSQAELEESNRRLAELIDSMKSAVVLQDDEDRVVLVNQAFVEMWHLPGAPEELKGRTLSSAGFSAKAIVEPPNFAQLAMDLRARAERAEGLRISLLDGRVLEVDFLPVVTADRYRGRLSVLRDVTRQARAEEERERLLLSEREENRRLAEADAIKSEFFAVVSHELRTPLTSIVGYTQLLRNLVDERDGVEDSEYLEYLDAIARNVERLLRLAGDLVVLDSIESGSLPMRPVAVDVAALVAAVARTVAPQSADGSVSVATDVEPGPPLRADPDRLEQLLENLVSNAVKFTPGGGRVLIRAKPEGSGWQLQVTDTGIGVPEDEIGLLYQRFFRGSNALRRGLPGSGLGLSVARAIVDLHGGSISLASALGSGTSVTVFLPDLAQDVPDAEPGGVLTPVPRS